MKISIDKLNRNFTQIYGKQTDVTTYFAPENINILGFYHKNPSSQSLSFKISSGNYLMLTKRDDNDFRLAASEDKQRFVFGVGNNCPRPEDKWINYPQSIICTLLQKGYKLPFGLNLYFDTDFKDSNINRASLLMLTAKAMNDVYELTIPAKKLLRIVIEVADEYFQNFVSEKEIEIESLDSQDSFIYSENSDKISLVDLDTQINNYSFIFSFIANKVSDSVCYRKKVEESFDALESLAETIGLSSLKQLTPNLFEKQKHQIKDKVLQKRAWFIIYELQRCSLAVDFLKKSDFKAFGQLLNQSEVSLQRDFDFRAVDNKLFIDIAWKQQEIYGLRSVSYITNSNITLCLLPKFSEESFIRKIETEVLAAKKQEMQLFTPKLKGTISKV